MKRVTFESPYLLKKSLGLEDAELSIEKIEHGPADFFVRIAIGDSEVYIDIDEFSETLNYLRICSK
jgi:hypothetical protein